MKFLHFSVSFKTATKCVLGFSTIKSFETIYVVTKKSTVGMYINIYIYNHTFGLIPNNSFDFLHTHNK